MSVLSPTSCDHVSLRISGSGEDTHQRQAAPTHPNLKIKSSENYKDLVKVKRLNDEKLQHIYDFRRRTLTAGKYAMPLTIQRCLKFTIDWLLDRVNCGMTDGS